MSSNRSSNEDGNNTSFGDDHDLDHSQNSANSGGGANQSVTNRHDIQSLMNEIRKRAEELATSQSIIKPPPFRPAKVDLVGEGRKAGELVASEELRYLNLHYAYTAFPSNVEIKTHRRGIIGSLVVKIKKKVLALLWSWLSDYFTAEREYKANLVRFLNDMSSYVDARDAANFWELIRKLDVDIANSLEKLERVRDSLEAEIVRLERVFRSENGQQIGSLLAASDSQAAQLKTLNSVVEGIESIICRLGVSGKLAATTANQNSKSVAADQKSNRDLQIDPNTDWSYLVLENRFRGSFEEIKARVSRYVPMLRSLPGPVLEIGCGRGELLSLLSHEQIIAYGVDVDKAMVLSCRELGLDSRHEDVIKHLKSIPEKSLGGAIAVQVVEHLNKGTFDLLLQLLSSRIKRGGRVIFETINPCSLLALSSNYFRDPTHVFPVHPDTLAHRLAAAGFNVMTTEFISPVAQTGLLREVPEGEFLSPKWIEMVKLTNHNVSQLNKLLYGNQDYYIVGEIS